MSKADEGFVGGTEVNVRLGEKLFQEGPIGSYDPEEYRFERIIGVRNKNSTVRLKRLKPVHKTVIALHIRTLSNRDIAIVTGLNESRVSQIINDPLSQEYIRAHIQGMDNELEVLASLAVDAVRTGLQSNDEKVKLIAADRFFKATGRYNKEDSGRETAEDVLARALAHVAQENASALREVTRGPTLRVIEGRAKALPSPEED